MRFGTQLKELRQQSGLSQQELANAVGLAQTYISALENRESLPRAETLTILTEYFGVSVSYFLPPQNETLNQVKVENRKLKRQLRAIRDLLNRMDLD